MNEHNDLDLIVLCKHCGEPEYYIKMTWRDGKEMCRVCYKHLCDSDTCIRITWPPDYLKDRPSLSDYNNQEVRA